MSAKKYLLSILPLAILFASCAKTEPAVPKGTEQREEISTDPIVFSMNSESLGTKAYVTRDNLSAEGNRFRVFDYYVGSEGVPVSYFNKKDVDGKILEEGEWLTAGISGNKTVWDFYNGTEYKWTVSGTHNFFGWLIKDAIDPNAALEAPAGLTYDTTDPTQRKINYPTTTFTNESPLFDFMYSNVIARKMTGEGDNHKPVELKMDHLFSALEFGAENKIDKPVTLKRLAVYGLKNTNSATITFATPELEGGSKNLTADASCVYGEGTKSATPIVIYDCGTTNGITLNPKSAGDGTYVLSLIGNSMLMWPHWSNDTVEDLKPLHEFGNDPETNKAFWNESDPLIVATYVLDGETITRPVAFPLKSDGSGKYISLNAGERHHIVVSFVDKLLQVNLNVLPWDYEEHVINYSDGTIEASTIFHTDNKDYKIFYDYDRLTKDADGNLIIDNTKGQSSVDDTNKKVSVKDGKPVKVRFRLNTPQGAKWFVSLKGDINAFRVEKITDNEVDGTDCDFQLIPSTGEEYANPKKDYEVTLHIVLQLPDGRMVSADEVLLQDQYTIVLPKAS